MESSAGAIGPVGSRADVWPEPLHRLAPDAAPAPSSSRIKPRPLLEVSVDAFLLTIAVLVIASPDARGWLLLFIPLCIAALSGTGYYTKRFSDSAGVELRRAMGASAIALMTIISAQAGLEGEVRVGADAGLLWAVAIAVMAGVRATLVMVDAHRRRKGRGLRRVVILGAGEIGRLAARRLHDRPDLGLRPIGFLDSDPLEGEEDDPRVLGACRDLDRVVAEQDVDVVLVGFSTSPHSVLLDTVHRCWELGVEVLVIPRLFEVEGTRTEVRRIGGLPFVALHPATGNGVALRLKYGLERVLAALLLLAALPILAVAAAYVKLYTRGPVLYRSARVGENGRVFDMLKLRTMNGTPATRGEADAEWAQAVLRSASIGRRERLKPVPDVGGEFDACTVVGRVLRRTSLDELPQLWNVVRGDMALVGPRPERVHYSELFSQAVYRYGERYRVRPGITGWAQIQGLRGKTSLRDRVEWDNFYIENWSPWLDMKIIVLTPAAILRSCRAKSRAHRGAAASAAAAMSQPPGATPGRAGPARPRPSTRRD